MVVKMLKWRPWLPLPSKQFLVRLKLQGLEGLFHLIHPGKLADSSQLPLGTEGKERSKIAVKIKWKGPRRSLGLCFKRNPHRAKTSMKIPQDSSSVVFEEDFKHTCVLTISQDNCFIPWDINFTICQVSEKSKLVVLGSAKMNLAEFVSMQGENNQEKKIQVLTSSGIESEAIIIVSVNSVELQTPQNISVDRSHLLCFDGSLSFGIDEAQCQNRDAEECLKTLNSVKKVETDVEECSSKSERISDSSRNSFYSDTSDEWDEAALVAEKYCIHSYGTLSGVNLIVEGALSHCAKNKHAEDHTPSTCNRVFTESLTSDEACASLCSGVEQSNVQSSVLSLLTWKKRKLSFRSPRQREEPLLKKAYGENGGDDIDFDRRLSNTPMSSYAMMPRITGDSSASHLCEVVDFGGENFAIGSWEWHEIVSRDKQSKISADVFFATLDQRNEKAAGESACTALVVVIADWLHRNPGRMPIKAELDTLIRDGSAEWRRLCDDEAYRECFPDKHFDLDTILRAKVRPLIDVAEHSFVGFFQPQVMEGSCDFLQGVMTFDGIWEEIIRASSNGSFQSEIYIVSWNDHFFILKVEQDVCYIIDTLGERLFEGCKQAYILRFDKDTTILPHVPQLTDEKKDHMQCTSTNKADIAPKTDGDPEWLDGTKEYRGTDACKEFIKGFFAALPLRELEMDMQRGLLGRAPLHQRLQIEFHYTSLII